MKRISTLILAAAIAFGGMTSASAESNVDVKVKGAWDFTFGWLVNDNFSNHRDKFRNDERGDDAFIARQRVRTQINFIISENLQGVLQFEIGDTAWGQDSERQGRGGGQIGTDGINIKTKHAYLDWMVPDTGLHIRMGLQPILLPSAKMGSPIWDEDAAAVVASYQFDDTFALTAFWSRPYDQDQNDSNLAGNTNDHWNDEMDVWGVIAPITLDGMTFTPWGAIANIGSASGYYGGLIEGLDGTREHDRATAWWAGLAANFELFDPLTFGFDVMYGRVSKATLGHPIFQGGEADLGARGWFLDAYLDYKLDWGTPGIFGWYSTGDTKKSLEKGNLGRIPTLVPGFTPTSFGFDGNRARNTADVISASGIGTWGLGIQIADMSFIEDLSHTLRFAYIRGTNAAWAGRNLGEALAWGEAGDNVYMTTKDQAFEINFDHEYQIYENLTAVLELGWVKMDRSDDVWEDNFQDKSTWKAQLGFEYRF